MNDPGSGDGAARVAVNLAAKDACLCVASRRDRGGTPSFVRAAFRPRVVAEASVPSARVEEVARRHGVCTRLVYRWRRGVHGPALTAPLVRLVPVRVSEATKPEAMQVAPRPVSNAGRPGLIEIETSGGVRIRVDEDVSLAALRRVLTALR